MPYEGEIKHIFDYTPRQHVLDEMSFGGDPLEEIEKQHLGARLYHILDNLPWKNAARLKEVFILSNMDGMSNEELAQRYGVTPKRIEQLLEKVNWKVEVELDLGLGYFKELKKNKDNDCTEHLSL